MDEVFALIEHNKGRAAELGVPILMILSPRDVVIDSQAAQAYAEQMTHPETKVVLVDNTGHDMLVDHQWPVLVQEIESFIKRKSLLRE